MADQLSIFDALAALNPRLVVEVKAEPGWIWAACPVCAELRYLRRRDAGSRCILTMNCPGRLEAYLDLACAHCARPVTARRSGKDTRYCSKKCEEEWKGDCEEFGCHE